ncbi:bifunctional phosphatase IMPL2, chloroplastic-like [Apium graveolens]|uniref:bifunctional phosphatase IMPL2, chloroplastic-like n=1 Tax=Apium graveolens TaxID=4045 RepID=UPI003D7A694C
MGWLPEERLAEFVWVLDPIDGTTGFRVRLFDTLIALLHKSKPILGIIDRPILRKRWVGVQGRPTTVDGLHIQTRSCEWLSQETLSNFRLPNSLLLRYASSPLHFNDDEREAFDHVTKKNLPNERTRGILNEEKNVTEAILDEGPTADVALWAPHADVAGGPMLAWQDGTQLMWRVDVAC